MLREELPQDLLLMIQELDYNMARATMDRNIWKMCNLSTLKILVKGEIGSTQKANDIKELAIESRHNQHHYNEMIRIFREEKDNLIREWKGLDGEIEDIINGN